ncbi:hypothetical protein D1Y84_16650 [Acidipila sp. EB88]|nr:hypothetical protein D1Y84_16650 [Acidipila sp. EB88]
MLLRQSRILLLLLLVWPLALCAILLAADHGKPSSEDVSAILQQELFYGLALIGLGASVALGTEQRAHRTQQVLSRAVGRAEYLLALGLSAYLPFAGYVAVWALSAASFAVLLKTPMPLSAIVAELAAGLLLCASGLFFSVVFAQLIATACTGAVLALLILAGTHGIGGPAGLFGWLADQQTGSPLAVALQSAEVLVLAAGVCAAACTVFARKDLQLH